MPLVPAPLPRLIPTGLPPAVVLKPLMVFKVTVAAAVTPCRLGVPTNNPVALPFVVLNVLIVFNVTRDAGKVPSTCRPVSVPADEKFVIVFDLMVEPTPPVNPAAACRSQGRRRAYRCCRRCPRWS
jgi:hypothetical protein